MTQPNTATARRAMIDSQLRTSGINEPVVLERMGAVPREAHLPADLHPAAYTDRAVALPNGGALAAPVFYGALLTEARIHRTDRVLIVDGGSGYLTALIGPLVATAKTVTASALAAGKVRGQYDLVLVDGALEDVPPALAKLLAPEGRVVTGIVDRGVTRLAAGRRSGSQLALLPVQEMGIPALPDFARRPAWNF